MSKSKLDLITKEELLSYINSSSSFEELCHKIGYKQINPDLQARIIKLCEIFSLDTSLIEGYALQKPDKTCSVCQKTKPITEFYSRRNVCKECVCQEEREKYSQKMIQLNKYKKELSCAKCNDNRFYLLDFHHIDPTQKDYTISDNSRAKMETILEEINKCIPLCANCHREFHYLNRENGISLETYLGS